MEKKSLLQEIAENLAVQRGIPKKNAETFCRIFFEVIEEGLRRDKFVKVKGFGTFKLIPVSERESVDVNTGERIQIGSHTKVTFTPDAFIRDLVNKPFSHFQTITLNDETHAEELETANDFVEQEELLAAEAAAALAVEPAPEPPAAQEAEESSAPEDAGTDEAVPTGNAEPVAVTPAPPTASAAPASAEEPLKVAAAPVATPPSGISATEPPTAAAEAEEMPTASPSGETPATASVTPPAPPETPADIPATPAAAEEDTEESATVTSGQQDRVKYVVEGFPRRRGLNWWKTMALTLFVLLLMGLSYFAGYYKVFCPPCNTSLPPLRTTSAPTPPAAPPAARHTAAPVAPTPPRDTARSGENPPSPEPKEQKEPTAVTAAPAATTPPATAEKPAAAPTVTYDIHRSYTITGTRELHTIVVGDNIYNIAARYYGNKNFAPYIIRHNQLKDPDNIVIGGKLKLPELTPQK
jgi:nucleoid DNA-binding protein